MKEQKRLSSLDMLRGLAILLVIGRHLPECPQDYSFFLRQFFNSWNRIGWVGVDLFFVLSGFLVSGLIFLEYGKRGSFQLSRFFIRRGFKIYPAFYLMIAATLSLGILYHHSMPPLRIIGELAFVQNYLGGLWNHTWSLAVEEHFYLLLGIVMFFFSRRSGGNPFRIVPAIYAAVGIGALILRLLHYWMAAAPYSHLTYVFPTHLRLDSLMFGVLLSYLYHYKADPLKRFVLKNRFGILGFGSALVLPSLFIKVEEDFFMNTFGLTCLYVGFGCMLLFVLYPGPAIKKRPLRSFAARVFACFGFYSYSIYLWHMPFLTYGPRFIQKLGIHLSNHMAFCAFWSLACLLGGVVMARLVEVPFLLLRDRLFPASLGLTAPDKIDRAEQLASKLYSYNNGNAA
jgi:peptidoglycan/LPS O-acetylase OafA/YrhL